MNVFCWVQLQTPSLKKAQKFYSSLFQWDLHEGEEPDHSYVEIDAGDGPMGGMIEIPDAGAGWLPFVQVDDVRSATQRARALGADVLVEPEAIANGGFYSIVEDPEGAALGLYQPPLEASVDLDDA